MKLFFILGAYFCCIFFAQAETEVDERVLRLEAEVNVLKEDLESTRNLAEQERPSAFNPQISLIGDLIGQYGMGVVEKEHHHDHGHDHDHGFQDGVFVREVEIEFRGDISPDFDSLITIAFEQHKKNKFDIHVEEVFARYKGWPLELKMGRFKTAIGRMNRIHRHNIPHITYPLSMQRFLGEEGYISQGISLSGSHAFFNSAALSYVLEGVMGNHLPMQDKGAEKSPQAIGHLWWHQELAPTHFFDLGASALVGRQGKAKSGSFLLFGADLHYSFLPNDYGQDPAFLLGVESYLAKGKKKVDKDKFEEFLAPGGFIWAQSKLIGSTFLGLRYDIAPKEEELNKSEHALGVYLGYYFSEFLRYRLGYEHVMPSMRSFNGDHRLMLSMNFVLGSHPVEPYFANR